MARGGDRVIGTGLAEGPARARRPRGAKSNLAQNTITGTTSNDTIVGTDLDDLIMGLAGSDTLYGGLGSDTLDGGAASDFLFGGDGSDVLFGRTGNDTLEGGAGADSLDGGNGIDFASYAGAASGVTLDLRTGGTVGDAAGDTFNLIEGIIGSASADFLTGSDAANTIRGGAGDDRLAGGLGIDTLEGGLGADSLDGGAEVDFVSYENAAGAVGVDLGTNISQTGFGFLGEAVGDRFFSITGIIGSAFGDTLIGQSDSVDTIYGGDGNDVLFGDADLGTGDHTLYGGAGLNRVSYESETAGITIDLIGTVGVGGDATGERLFDIEVLTGGSGNDVLGGSASNDTLDGSIGNDTLFGGDANDLLLGGAGADTIFGGAGIDTARYFNDATGGVTVNLEIGQGFGNIAEGDRLSEIERVVGTFFSDVLIGSSLGAETLEGEDNDDTLAGLGGGDTLDGGLGSDTASYAASAAGVTVVLDGSLGSGGDAEGDVFIGIENLIGSNLADRLTGDAAGNVISGGAGNDILSGLGDADTLYGGDNNDTILDGAGGDTIYGDLGADTVRYFNNATGSVTVSLDTGLGFGDIAEGDRLFGIENLVGTVFADTLTGSAGDNLLNGAGGADLLIGLAGNDILLGGTGDDRLIDIAGADSLFGEDGNDTIQFNGQAFILSGGTGTDTLLGTAGADTIDLGLARFSAAGGGSVGTVDTTGGGFEVFDLGDGNDTLYYSTVGANDLASTVYGGLGNDVISMLDGDVNLASSHTLYGGEGADRIWAGWFGIGGNATVFGGDGADFIYSGGGAPGSGGFDDTLYGGEGFDVYYWSANSGGFGTDIIFDSSAGGNGLVIFGGNAVPASGFPDEDNPDNDPVNGRVNLFDLGGGLFKIENTDTLAGSITFRGGDITVINLHHRPVGVPGENFVYTWDGSGWVDQNG